MPWQVRQQWMGPARKERRRGIVLSSTRWPPAFPSWRRSG